MKKVLVVGIGNLLLQDEGVGCHAVKRLQQMEWPEEVDFVEAGTGSYDLVDYFCQGENLIVIDALKAGGEPGAIYRAPLDQLGLKSEEGISLHQMSFSDAMQMVKLLGYNPRVIVYGIEPHTIDWGLELTPVVEQKMPVLLNFIRQEIEQILAS